MLITYRYRIKDGSRSRRRELRRMAKAVNVVWNYCNGAQAHAIKHRSAWPSAIDLCNLVAGSSKLLGLGAQTIQSVCQTYSSAREAKGKTSLRWRGRRSLGWIPFKAAGIRQDGHGWVYLKRTYPCWLHRELPDGAVIRSGSFNEDACGNWYISVVVKVKDAAPCGDGRDIGIDLGLKDLATFSTGEVIRNPRHLGTLAKKMARAQRANKKKLAARTHRKIARARADYLHKVSRGVVTSTRLVVVGDVSSSKLVRTNFAKSVLDAGWASLKEMLRYKATARGASFICVAEHGTTRTCSICGNADGGPKGIAEIGIRDWTCSGCGTAHDRDVNAARNILRRGLATLAEGALT